MKNRSLWSRLRSRYRAATIGSGLAVLERLFRDRTLAPILSRDHRERSPGESPYCDPRESSITLSVWKMM
jgi:hypothetical protein